MGIVGNGRIAKECASILKSNPACALKCIIIDGSRSNFSSDLEKYCDAQGLDHIVSEDINSPDVIEYVRNSEIDHLFSINNHQIIRNKLLDAVPKGIINFHNGPLPRYGGLNACSWAIFNGEAQHGVTWHYVSAGVDEGDIVAQRLFNIDVQSTALQLVMVSINEGIDLFREVIGDVLSGTVTRTPQNSLGRTYHFAREVPGGGVVDCSREYESVERLVRALNFNPLESPLGHATAVINKRKFSIDKVALTRRVQQGANGEVIRADNALEVQVSGAVMTILEVRNDQGKRVPVRELVENYSIKPGMHVGKETS